LRPNKQKNERKTDKMKLQIIIASMFAACSLHAAEPSNAQLQAEIVELRQQLSSLLPLAALIKVDPNPENNVCGPNIVITGNVHIVNGSGQTGIVNGLGNLIIGYDEPTPSTAIAGNRSGSHNVIIGRYHTFPSSFRRLSGCRIRESSGW
jgi:hypothetical protein